MCLQNTHCILIGKNNTFLRCHNGTMACIGNAEGTILSSTSNSTQ